MAAGGRPITAAPLRAVPIAVTRRVPTNRVAGKVSRGGSLAVPVKIRRRRDRVEMDASSSSMGTKLSHVWLRSHRPSSSSDAVRPRLGSSQCSVVSETDSVSSYKKKETV
jgi:hypothetical protein